MRVVLEASTLGFEEGDEVEEESCVGDRDMDLLR